MPYTVKITMTSNNGSAKGAEIEKILRRIAEQVAWGDGLNKPILDINGNKIGHVTIKFSKSRLWVRRSRVVINDKGQSIIEVNNIVMVDTRERKKHG